jgi:hypothetical protein
MKKYRILIHNDNSTWYAWLAEQNVHYYEPPYYANKFQSKESAYNWINSEKHNLNIDEYISELSEDEIILGLKDEIVFLQEKLYNLENKGGL